jgi:hypothetical protein
VVTRLALVLTLAGGCVSPPGIDVPDEAVPFACEQTRSAAVGRTSQLGVALTSAGATAVWVPAGGGPLMSQALARDGRPLAEPEVAWAGSYEGVTVAAIDEQVIVGAVDGDVTWMLAAPFGMPPYRELAIVGGVVGASPLVLAGGQRVTASVSYGGMLVNSFDDAWRARTSVHAVLTASSREVAMAQADGEALVAWPTATACFVERLYNAWSGITRSDEGRCGTPRLAASGGDAALVFERDGDILVARATPDALRARDAAVIARGREPRVVAHDGAYWVSYLDPSGDVVAGRLDDELRLHGVALGDEAGAADAHELVVSDGLPRAFVAGPGGLTTSGLCTP